MAVESRRENLIRGIFFTFLKRKVSKLFYYQPLYSKMVCFVFQVEMVVMECQEKQVGVSYMQYALFTSSTFSKYSFIFFDHSNSKVRMVMMAKTVVMVKMDHQADVVRSSCDVPCLFKS